MKSGNLNFLEPSGPLQACDGIIKMIECKNARWKPEITYFNITIKYILGEIFFDHEE